MSVKDEDGDVIISGEPFKLAVAELSNTSPNKKETYDHENYEKYEAAINNQMERRTGMSNEKKDIINKRY